MRLTLIPTTAPSSSSLRFLRSRFYRPFSPPKHLRSFTTTVKMTSSSQTVEHVVLFKVKPGTEPSKISAMISGLNSLTSLDSVLHLSAAAVLRSRTPPPLSFTHLLHSRYSSKDNLAAYSAHPSHLSVVKESVLPICDDIMAVDWLSDCESSVASPPVGSALRLSFLKLREGYGEEAKSEVLAAIKGVKDGFGEIRELSVGENFSPARAKGFSIASIAVFPGTSELEKVDLDKEAQEKHKEKVRDYLESVIVVDYVISSPQSANL